MPSKTKDKNPITVVVSDELRSRLKTAQHRFEHDNVSSFLRFILEEYLEEIGC